MHFLWKHVGVVNESVLLTLGLVTKAHVLVNTIYVKALLDHFWQQSFDISER